MQSPFISFIILFCHIIETSEVTDLERMSGLVDTLELKATSNTHNTCAKQLRLFKALYDVAAKYIEVRSRKDGGGQALLSWSMSQQQQYAGECAGDAFGPLDSVEVNEGLKNALDPASATIPVRGNSDGSTMGFMDSLAALPMPLNTSFGDMDMEMDLSGAQLWDWFNKNQSIMRMLEDT